MNHTLKANGSTNNRYLSGGQHNANGIMLETKKTYLKVRSGTNGLSKLALFFHDIPNVCFTTEIHIELFKFKSYILESL